MNKDDQAHAQWAKDQAWAFDQKCQSLALLVVVMSIAVTLLAWFWTAVIL